MSNSLFVWLGFLFLDRHFAFCMLIFGGNNGLSIAGYSLSMVLAATMQHTFLRKLFINPSWRRWTCLHNKFLEGPHIFSRGLLSYVYVWVQKNIFAFSRGPTFVLREQYHMRRLGLGYTDIGCRHQMPFETNFMKQISWNWWQVI